jgi:L-aspartate oxidase
MTRGSGAVRSAESLDRTAATLSDLFAAGPAGEAEPRSWETTNLLHVGQVLTLAALLREETRGGHVRSDFTVLDDEHWRGHTLLTRRTDGQVEIAFEPVAAQDVT